MTIVFVRTRHEYGSYWHFWRLVELSGYQTCFYDEADLDDPGKFYIATPTNGELATWTGKMERPLVWDEQQPPPVLRTTAGRKAKTVWWCLEQHAPAGDGPLSPRLDELLGPDRPFDRVWASDEHFCKTDPRIEFVRLGSSPGMNTTGTLAYTRVRHEYDAAPMAYLWGRRAAIVEQLLNFGVKLGPNSSEEPRRSEILATSRWFLNLQQYSEPHIAPLRAAIAAAYGCALLSEPLGVPFPHVVEATDPAQMAAIVCDERSPTAKRVAENLHNYLCVDNTFKSFVDAKA